MLYRIARTLIIIISIVSISFLIYEFWLKYELKPVVNIGGNKSSAGNIKTDTTKLDPSVKVDKVIVNKEKRQMMLFKNNEVLKTYQISLGKNPVGPKEKEVDKKTPEGKYILDWKNPNSKYHLSIHISYPNDEDKGNARLKGIPSGGDIMIHGCPNGFGWNWKYYKADDWTDGLLLAMKKLKRFGMLLKTGQKLKYFLERCY